MALIRYGMLETITASVITALTQSTVESQESGCSYSAPGVVVADRDVGGGRVVIGEGVAGMAR